MRKSLLLLMVAFFSLYATAQVKQRMELNTRKMFQPERSGVPQYLTNAIPHEQLFPFGQISATKLHSERIGSAGNLLSIIDGGCNQIDVNDSLNAVTFIHRNDPSQFPGPNSNVAQYRFDISKNRGNSWITDIGPITNDDDIDNNLINGRFPQAAIFNPAGNTLVDSAYLIYSGTWHDNNTWSGQMRGRGKLSGDTSTFNVKIDPINNKKVAVATGFCKGTPGVFWNLNRSYTGSFTAGPYFTDSLIVQKGVWNTLTKDVDWTNRTIYQNFMKDVDDAGNEFSLFYSPNIAFDPTGQYGWIVCLADITASADSALDPVFWKTIDAGNTWTGPIRVDLDSLTEVTTRLADFPGVVATSTTDGDLTVDAWGNPHLAVVVGSGDNYNFVYTASFDIWDVTYNAAGPSCVSSWNGWGVKFIDSIETPFAGDMAIGSSGNLTEANRPLASRSPDGKKVFFVWSDSDVDLVGNPPENILPNLFARGFDLETYTHTPLMNLTEGDSLWGGETGATGGGVFGGSKYATISPTALTNGEDYNVPMVLPQIDYNFDLTTGLGSSEEPAAFWYINNLNFLKSDFSEGFAAGIQIVGNDVVTIAAGQPYTEDSADIIYYDTACYQTGPLHVEIDMGNFNNTVGGTYIIYYYLVDANGNVYATDSRTVIVGAAPTANFSWIFPSNACVPKFNDQSTNTPTNWTWTFGDGSTPSSSQSPLHSYPSDGSYNVCLTASNSFGSSAQICKLVDITGCINSGIEETGFAKMISLFPNPTNGKVFVNFEGGTTADMTLTVYNVLGATVVAPAKYKAGTSRIELDLSAVYSGLYMVKIQNNNESVIKHITVSHK